MRLFIVDGIKYQRIGDEDYYAQELFETEELHGYLSKNMLESQKSVFTCVVYDSDVEAEFARSLPTVEKSGTVVLAEHRDIQAPEFAGAYTVKVFEGEG